MEIPLIIIKYIFYLGAPGAGPIGNSDTSGMDDKMAVAILLSLVFWKVTVRHR
jgi:hypothetical protein